MGNVRRVVVLNPCPQLRDLKSSPAYLSAGHERQHTHHIREKPRHIVVFKRIGSDVEEPDQAVIGRRGDLGSVDHHPPRGALIMKRDIWIGPGCRMRAIWLVMIQNETRSIEICKNLADNQLPISRSQCSLPNIPQ